MCPLAMNAALSISLNGQYWLYFLCGSWHAKDWESLLTKNSGNAVFAALLDFVHILFYLSLLSLLFFSTPQSSCRTWLSTVPKYIHSEFQSPRERRRISFPISNPGEELWLVQFESAVHSRTNQQWPEWRILHLNCGSQSYHLTGLEGQILADKTTGVHDKMWLLKGRIQVRG